MKAEKILCSCCGGNGVVKIPGGISTCNRCDGDCYEPVESSGASQAGAAHEHQKWCQHPYCVKCGMSREYHEEGPMTSHGFVQAECTCGVAGASVLPSQTGDRT